VGTRGGPSSGRGARAGRGRTQVDTEIEIGQLVGHFTLMGASDESPGAVALDDAARALLVVGDGIPIRAAAHPRERVRELVASLASD
jgi:hypothetical protein